MPQVYLIHFDTNLAHARHYIGQSKNVADRLCRHRTGRSQVHILHACNANGIGYNVVRQWSISDTDYAGRITEKKLKARKNARYLCPVCNPQGWQQMARIGFDHEIRTD